MNKLSTPNYKIKLYYLYNYELDEVFYVGATRKELKNALSVHICAAHKRWGKPDSIQRKRGEYIKQYQQHITIEFLEETDYENVNIRECHYYHYFTRQGFTLVQSLANFHYNKPAAITTDQMLDYERNPKSVHRIETGQVYKAA